MKALYAKINSREGKTGAQLLNINMEVKDKLEAIYNLIERMRESINNDRDTNVSSTLWRRIKGKLNCRLSRKWEKKQKN